MSERAKRMLRKREAHTESCVGWVVTYLVACIVIARQLGITDRLQQAGAPDWLVAGVVVVAGLGLFGAGYALVQAWLRQRTASQVGQAVERTKRK